VTAGSAVRGSASVETAVLAPALLLLLGLGVLAGRVGTAGAAVDAAAGAAARQASLTRTGHHAQATATRAAVESLAEQHLRCQHVTVSTDVSAFAAPPGAPGSVRVTVTCQLALADLALPGLPGTRTLTAHAVSPLDPYRGRTR